MTVSRSELLKSSSSRVTTHSISTHSLDNDGILTECIYEGVALATEAASIELAGEFRERTKSAVHMVGCKIKSFGVTAQTSTHERLKLPLVQSAT